ncbi:hypothetical protein ACXQAU_002748 [Citrobacter freundii]
MSSREKFEQAIKARFGNSIDYRVCKNSDGEYMAWDMQVAWWAWQAAETDMAVQLANAESKCRELAAENAHARERHVFIRALAVSILEHSGGRMDWRGAMEDATELLQTVDSVYAKKPATDAFLAEVRAQARNELLTAFRSSIKRAGLTDGDSVTTFEAHDALKHCIEQLNEGAAQ